MIFATIGSMFPFDRMIRALDAFAAAAAETAPGEEILAQIGNGGYEPAHMRWVRRMGQDDFDATAAGAELMVAHAGMGSVITAGRLGVPIVLLPRLQVKGEHNTDHQVATAGWLRGRPGVFVADDESELAARIGEARVVAGGRFARMSATAPPEFIARLRACLLG